MNKVLTLIYYHINTSATACSSGPVSWHADVAVCLHDRQFSTCTVGFNVPVDSTHSEMMLSASRLTVPNAVFRTNHLADTGKSDQVIRK